MLIEKVKKFKFIIIFLIFYKLYLSDILVEKRIKEDIKFWVDDNINYRLDIITKALQKNKSHLNKFYNDYNEEFLPETQNNSD